MPDLTEIRRAGVQDDEVVARAIFSPSSFNRDGTIGPQAFFMTPLRGGRREKDISVLRESLCEDLISSVKRGSLSYKRMSDDVEVEVKASPSISQPAHAGIIVKNHNRRYTSADNNIQPLPPALMNVMSKMAAISKYVPLA